MPLATRLSVFLLLLFAASLHARSAVGASNPLVIVQDGRPLASVVLAGDASPAERVAAAELVKYVELMSGAQLPLVIVPSGTRVLPSPAILLGKVALRRSPELAVRLEAAARKSAIGTADAIALRRHNDRLYLAGNSDDAHAFAVTHLLEQWGCRWYMPTEFGEVVPEQRTLAITDIDHAYGSPFQIRSYWLSWGGDSTGQAEFLRRNYGSPAHLAVPGHALARYTRELAPPGKSAFHVPLSEPRTAIAVANQIEHLYARGTPSISLSVEDGIYRSTSSSDQALQAGIFDKYMLAPSHTDAMLTLYNSVGRILRERHPASPTKISGLAYSNVTLPPQQVGEVEPNVVIWIAPIDIDPNHGMDHPDSPPRQEYKGMMYRWADLLDGRLAIYDYDQGQLVWRDLPNPSHHVFAQDVQHYRKAGILGVSTESRGATATTFLNLFVRLQLLWNPDRDVAGLLEEFYPKFYGPAAEPMRAYWSAIYSAWAETLATEHEYFIAPVIYTPELLDRLRAHLQAAMAAVRPLEGKPDPTRNEQRYLERMRFTALSFGLIESYLGMVQAAAGEADYQAAVAAGERALALREELTAMNPTFTTYKVLGENGHAWLPGEVAQMRELHALTNGSKGHLVARTPRDWAFRRDPRDTGLPRGWAYSTADLSHWEAVGKRASAAERKDGGAHWEVLRTDIYMQGQGIRHADRQSFTGYYWYQAGIDLAPAQTRGELHLMFPGLFNQAWLYVNGQLVAHRQGYREPWWKNDYRLQWDVDLTGRLRPGKNLIVLRGATPHHFGGMFRRPFIYRKSAEAIK